MCHQPRCPRRCLSPGGACRQQPRRLSVGRQPQAPSLSARGGGGRRLTPIPSHPCHLEQATCRSVKVWQPLLPGPFGQPQAAFRQRAALPRPNPFRGAESAHHICQSTWRGREPRSTAALAWKAEDGWTIRRAAPMTISRGGSSAGDLDRDEAPGHLALPPTAPPQPHTRADAEGVLDLGYSRAHITLGVPVPAAWTDGGRSSRRAAYPG